MPTSSDANIKKSNLLVATLTKSTFAIAQSETLRPDVNKIMPSLEGKSCRNMCDGLTESAENMEDACRARARLECAHNME